MGARLLLLLLLFMVAVVMPLGVVDAGMPALLPTDWTAEHSSQYDQSNVVAHVARSRAPFLQAISFFTFVVLASAWVVQRLVRFLRRDLTFLPDLTYRRALGMVVLWGLLFVVVLTMISGARELMTPGAWRKQGWTYRLAESTELSPRDRRRADQDRRRAALESLRVPLWQHAATHEGRFPTASESTMDAQAWSIPGWPGLRFQLVPDRRAEDAGRLLVFEPTIDDDERLVLLTNGVIGTMRSAQINAQLPSVVTPVAERTQDVSRREP